MALLERDIVKLYPLEIPTLHQELFDVGIFAGSSRGCGLFGGFAEAFGDHFGHAEVGNFYQAFFIEQDVSRLDFAMNDARIVGELECLANLRHDAEI